MKIKTAELKGSALNWAVAKSEGHIDNPDSWLYQAKETDTEHYYPSTSWSIAGPIIEREKYTISFSNSDWYKGWLAATQLPSSYIDDELGYISDCLSGATPLEAAMRLFVTRKLGEEVEIPGEIK